MTEEQKKLLTEEERTEQPDFSMFSGQTADLLTKFWDSRNHFLSPVDIQDEVMFNEEATDGAIRTVIWRAKQELKKHTYPYDIKLQKNKGYQLIEIHHERHITSRKCHKQRKKPRK